LEENKSLTMEDKVFAALSYGTLLILVPYFLAKDRPFVRYHIIQGINLFIVEFIAGAIAGFLRIGIVSSAVSLLFFALTCLAIYYAITGSEKELPIIGQFKIVKSI